MLFLWVSTLNHHGWRSTLIATQHMTRMEVRQGCDPNCFPSSIGSTLLHILVLSTWITNIPYWCRMSSSPRGLRIDSKKELGISYFSHIMDLMIELGCDLEGRNHIGETSLLLACYTCDLQLLKVFLSKGADVFAVDMCGNGALHKLLFGRWTALWRDQDPAIYEMVTILIEHGCDPKALNNSGISPTEIAYSFERQGVAEIWLKALHSAGYVLRNAINRFGRRWGVAVLTSDRYAKKLPKSDLTIEEWAAIREQLHILSHDESNEIKLSEISRRARRMYDRIWKMMRVSGALSPSQVPRRNKRHFRSWYRYGRGQSKWQRHHQSHRFIDQFRFDKEYHYMMRVERVHDSHYS